MRYTRAFVLSVALGVVVLSALAFYGDAGKLLDTAASYPLPLLVPVLLLTVANYVLRWVKWRYYLRLIGAGSVGPRDSALIFLSGFAMGLTPGKVGEMVKPYLLKERYQVPLSSSAPILFAERMTDGLALVILAAAGVLVYGSGLGVMAGLVLVAVGIVATVRSSRLSHLAIATGARLPLLGRRVGTLRSLVTSAATLLNPRPLIFAVSLGIVSWGCEALAFFLVLAGLGIPASPTLLLQSTFALASATIFGSASLMPGGLGVAEASLAGFLQLAVGLSRTHAAYATLLIRLCTLWFGVGLGTLALLLLVGGRRAAGMSRETTGAARS